MLELFREICHVMASACIENGLYLHVLPTPVVIKYEGDADNDTFSRVSPRLRQLITVR